MLRRLAPAFAAAALLAAPAAEAGNTAFSSTQKSLYPNAQNPHPGAGYQGQVYVTPGGCSYSRAQVPGYKPTWHLILNGAEAGLTDAHRRCPTMLGDYERL
ncbi:hypothetical protein M4578_00150 [Salipiger sp. P9]|uniref:hypothetical protein n=1 Tax=Salipiger pentaromativorans TaxID=2943193 RepID=UPI0021577CB2|nr:hypothetical protein [Salipiger pentaromativorans]MCR8546219.1 hypothetical protein [Salipiger pentaromativorans]